VPKEQYLGGKMKERTTYTSAGVDTFQEEHSLQHLLKWVKKTFMFKKKVGSPKLEMRYFANVLDIGGSMGLAIATDGVGTKILVAQMMNKYDTIGIDCVAMNVNDIICVGAEPIALVNYIALEKPSDDLLEGIGKGLYEGARIANISIPGGEIAQIREMITGSKENYGFDLAGTAVGLVSLEKIIIGQDIREHDIVVGFKSSGIHSNGLTLARKVLFESKKFTIDRYFNELGKTIGEELLEPTHIYVPEIMEILNSNIIVKALIDITSDGLLNLTRVQSNVGYVIDYLPEPQPIFSLIQDFGNIKDEEMFRVFNMGTGFCIISPESELEKIIRVANKHNVEVFKMGYVIEDFERKVKILPKNLIGCENKFYKI
jgi:phosphoribosylformylglycinamidine cyclo-ligase